MSSKCDNRFYREIWERRVGVSIFSHEEPTNNSRFIFVLGFDDLGGPRYGRAIFTKLFCRCALVETSVSCENRMGKRCLCDMKELSLLSLNILVIMMLKAGSVFSGHRLWNTLCLEVC